jgi:hypothetical protein
MSDKLQPERFSLRWSGLTSSRWFESNREKRLGVKPLHLSVPLVLTAESN